MPQPTSASRLPLRLWGVLTLATALLASLTGCQGSSAGTAPTQARVDTVAAAPEPAAPKTRLSPLRGGRLRADVLLTSTKPLGPREIHEVAVLGTGAVAFATGRVTVKNRPVRVASVDPATFRRYAAAGTAESTAVWQAVADGQLVASHDIAKRLHLALGTDVRVAGRPPQVLRLGALATTGIPGTDLVVSTAVGKALGLPGPTSVLLNAGATDPVVVASKVRKVAGSVDPKADVDLLSPPAANPVAFLTGGAAAKAFGAFSYKYFPDGTIQPDAAWVRNNIVSATVPVLGKVTCHRLMVPQLRAALREVEAAGLAGSLHTYDGCYVPRFIERDPSHAISLHTWGIAIDMDASTNYRGIKGTMDPQVVQIFKRWGFRWGGDWSYSDPMHFELAALMNP